MRRVSTIVASSFLLASLLALAHAVTFEASAQMSEHASAGPATDPSPAASESTESVEAAVETPAEDEPVLVLSRPRITPITASMVAAMRRIADRDTGRADAAFAKMGGSSVASRAFLHCFESADVDLEEHVSLRETLDFFLRHRVGTHTSFGRDSIAAKVGWSVRHGMSGRPPAVVREERASRARWALVFFGSNDVEGKDAIRYGQRLDRLLSVLTADGVIPLLGATYPRRTGDAAMNEQVRLYNRMTSSIAAAWNVPYVDFHQAMLTLPRRGLAEDGYHPNTYVVGPRSRACDFGQTGLSYGNNTRNLMVLELLDAIRHAYVLGETAPEPTAIRGRGTSDDPVRVASLPFSTRLSFGDFAEEKSAPETVCGDHEAGGRQHVFRIRTDERMRVRLTALPAGHMDLHAEIESDGTRRCLGDGEIEHVITLSPGTSTFVITASQGAHFDRTDARALVILDAEPTGRSHTHTRAHRHPRHHHRGH